MVEEPRLEWSVVSCQSDVVEQWSGNYVKTWLEAECGSLHELQDVRDADLTWLLLTSQGAPVARRRTRCSSRCKVVLLVPRPVCEERSELALVDEWPSVSLQ